MKNIKSTEGVIKKGDKPVYPIGIVAEMVGITEQTLRLYEKRGLIKTFRRNRHRYYSENDVAWLICIRDAIHKDKISIEGLKKLLEYAPCWEIRSCPEQVKSECNAYKEKNKHCWDLKKGQCSRTKENGCSSCIVFVMSNKEAGEKINLLQKEETV